MVNLRRKDEAVTTPVLVQFVPGVETRLLTCSGQICNRFPGPELLYDWPVLVAGWSIIGLKAMLL